MGGLLITWIKYFLFVVFLLSGMGKLFFPTEITSLYYTLEFNKYFCMVIGLLEIILSLGLLTKYSIKLSVYGLFTLMCLGAIISILYGYFYTMFLPLIIMGLLLVLDRSLKVK